MGLFDGFTQGFYASVDEQRAENERRDKEARDNERSILTTLVNSPDVTDQVRQYALTGLLEGANPSKRKKGLRGFMGEMEQSPYAGHVRDFLATLNGGGGAPAAGVPGDGAPAATTAQGLPSAHLTPQATMAAAQATTTPKAAPQATAPPTAGGAALPASSPVTGGAMKVGPPPTATGSPTAAPAAPAAAAGAPPAAAFGPLQSAAPPAATPSGVMSPYVPQGKVFKSAEDIAVEKARGVNRGDVEGMKAGLEATGLFTPEEQAAIIKSNLERKYRSGTASPYGSIAGDAPDANGVLQPTFGVFDKMAGTFVDPETHQPIPGFRPRTQTGSKSYGQYYEQAAKFYGFPNGGSVTTPGDVQKVRQKALEFQQQDTNAAAGGRLNAAADAPLSTEQRFQATSNLQQEWQKVAAPVREMRRALATMNAGLTAAQHGDLNAGGQAILVSFQKMLDPQSVVRESEYARSAQGLSLMDRLYGFMQKLQQGGTGVPYDQLKAYVDLAGQLEAGATASISGERDRIAQEAQSWGLDPTQVLGQDAPTGMAPSGVGNPGPVPVPNVGGPSPVAPGAAPPRAAAPVAGPGPEWQMVGGVLYHNGKPY